MNLFNTLNPKPPLNPVGPATGPGDILECFCGFQHFFIMYCCSKRVRSIYERPKDLNMGFTRPKIHPVADLIVSLILPFQGRKWCLQRLFDNFPVFFSFCEFFSVVSAQKQ